MVRRFRKRPPIKLNEEREVPVHLFSNLALVERLKEMGGTPKIFENPELMDFYLPILRSDLTLCFKLETSSSGFPKLNIPISTFAGRDDEGALPSEMKDWRHFTTSAVDNAEFEGGHFYFHGIESQIASRILNNISKIKLKEN